jgi:hypothetical protein
MPLMLLALDPWHALTLVGVGSAGGFGLLVLVVMQLGHRPRRFMPRAVPRAAGPGRAAAAERRRAVRRGGQPVEILVRDKEETFPGWVMDRSPGGLGLQLPRPVGWAVTLSVRACDAPKGTPWVPVHVRRCQPLGPRHWSVGCQFVKRPRARR